VATLLGCSVHTTYRLIDNGTLKAVNLSERMTRIKRSELNKILS
ncbi:MAG: DNA-binding protein, partial [Bacteroidetes bacterium]